ncbi:hypothetical protein [Bifidobacterium primatium]|uniref:hypothetical protein n=1 Tax=Bifidobacterium primatium TaxID=2045438 RepID=UPI001055103D|nr:hypothetical protein [Bifidobacterium primatium]
MAAVETIESLPSYASTESVARSNDDNLLSVTNACLVGYAAGADDVEILVDDDYASSQVLSDESVYKTPDSTRVHFIGLIDEKQHGV